jgi:hypothetical protein
MMRAGFAARGRSPLLAVGMVVLWFGLVVGGVRLAEGGIRFWREQDGQLRLAKGKLSRLNGWIEVGEKVNSRRNDLLGSFHSDRIDLNWVALQGVQETAEKTGLSIEELKPLQALGRQSQSGRVRLDAKVAGDFKAIGRFLQRLPEVIPGVQLDSVRLTPAEGNRIQGVVRLSVAQGIFSE